MPQTTFIRNIEDFQCEYCGFGVRGSGYTNHCPACLWSKHVDIHPGDRGETCQGLMKPTAIEINKGEYVIVHQCQTCQVTKRNKASNNDQISEFLTNLLQ